MHTPAAINTLLDFPSFSKLIFPLIPRGEGEETKRASASSLVSLFHRFFFPSCSCTVDFPFSYPGFYPLNSFPAFMRNQPLPRRFHNCESLSAVQLWPKFQKSQELINKKPTLTHRPSEQYELLAGHNLYLTTVTV